MMAVLESESVPNPRIERTESDASPSWRFDGVSSGYLGQLKELWQFRDIFPTLLIRANSLVYEKAFFGIGWLIINTLAITLPFALILTRVFNFDTGGVPPSVFALAGFSIWTLFRSSAQWMMKGLNSNKSLMKSFNIPPLLLVSAMMANGLVSFFVIALILIGSIIYAWITSGILPLVLGWNLLLVVPVFVLTLIFALGLSCFTSILSTIAADTNHVLRYAMTGLMVASPVFYPVAIIEEKYRIWLYLNPMTGLVETFRWALFKVGDLNIAYLSLSLAVALLVLIAGTTFFLKYQRRILDFD